MKDVIIIVTVTVAALLSGFGNDAEAASIYGAWRSSSGNVFHITQAAGGFRLNVRLTTGQSKILRGNWVSGMQGLQFTYWDGAKITGTFRPGDPNRIRVVSGNTTTWWRRMGASRAPARGATIFGTWRSSTGNLFEVPFDGARQGAFDMILTHTNGRREVIRGRWVSGMRGTQFAYRSRGVRFTGTFRPGDPNRIRLAGSSGQVSWWTRERPTRRSHKMTRARAMPQEPAQRAMHSGAYSQLRAEVNRQSFSREKVRVIGLAAARNYFSCSQVRGLLKSIAFERDRLDALRALAPRIIDRRNAHTILSVFAFSNSKQKASSMLR